MPTNKTSWLSAAGLLVAGCAHTVPDELVDARRAYAQAEHGPAATLAPSDLHEAHKALDRAEGAFKEDGNEKTTRDYAYVAARKARIAEANASVAQAEQDLQTARIQYVHAERSALERAQGNLSQAHGALEDERQRRAAAEQRAKEAFAQLASMARVEQQPRGTVITLPGSLLFESGRADLLPTAEAKLKKVAEVLVTSAPDSSMRVEGHTDSQGAERFNQNLSEKRAQAVRTYLVAQGVASDRITAQGVGESQPVASNDNPEGRANNRRVEIVVEGGAGGAAAAGSPAPTTPATPVR